MEPYIAKGWLRNPNINTILSSSFLRKLKLSASERNFLNQSQLRVINAGDGIRLSTKFTTQSDPKAPVIILLHGWLGCAESRYLVSLGSFLFAQGFHVVRLNFRDHGFSEHLNEDLFHSCRLQEVIDACITIQNEFSQRAVSIIGFSLGGNFALRINANSNSASLHIYKTISFCPVMDPDHTLNALEEAYPAYSHYFIRLWKSSFKRKISAFPEKYSKTLLKEFKSLRTATERLAVDFAGYENLQSYLQGYSITGEKLKSLQAPADIILAKDDPIIPWQDHLKIAHSPRLSITHCLHGGHCGFLSPNLRSPWLNQFSLQALKQHN
jgi:predicted alpha/beta-fold hydrolase